jgi:hypothetical protein
MDHKALHWHSNQDVRCSGACCKVVYTLVTSCVARFLVCRMMQGREVGEIVLELKRKASS